MLAATTKLHYGLPTIFMALALLFAAAPVGAQGPGPFVIEHYYVYNFVDPISGNFPMRNTDQFLTSDNVAVTLEKFAVPVDKNSEGKLDNVTHYTWWQITGDLSNPVPVVAVENQFGAQTLNVGLAAFLLNPALKNSAPPAEPPTDKNHYKCYNVTGNALFLITDLDHQFGLGETVDELNPRYLCNPVVKRLPDDTEFPIVDPDHLVCYEVNPGVPVSGISVGLLDQFVDVTVVPTAPELLCVPSEKQIPTQTSESTWGEVKSIYR
jgi:hypothetical protein